MIADLVECPVMRASLSSDCPEKFLKSPGIEPYILRAAEYLETRYGQIFRYLNAHLSFADLLVIARDRREDFYGARFRAGVVPISDRDWNLACLCCSYLDVNFWDGVAWEESDCWRVYVSLLLDVGM